jgi:23S rRNA (guanine2445-N2)-methyltransferase / 23S rRNA (guanine2069-N7)-methyltransferase
MPLSFFVTAPRGLEPVLGVELRALGAADVEERRAGVVFTGELETAYRACLWSRVGNRVLLPLAHFPAGDAAALYEGVQTVDWREHVSPDGTLAVDFTSIHSHFAHTQFGAQKTKDAIVDQLRERTGRRPSVDLAAPDVRVYVHVEEDQATVGVDLAGESLHRRGYRRPGAPAPLKENLAAGLLLYADWPRRAAAGEPLVDPMCGTGTLPVEAALIAADRAPGLGRRRFGFVGWRGHDAQLWRRLHAEAEARVVRDVARLPPIYAWDADAAAVRAALGHADGAGVGRMVRVQRRALAEAAPPDGAPGLVVANPPYGERLGDEAALGPLYRELGDVLRRRFTGWTAFILTGNLALGRQIGLRPTERRVVYNGALECRLITLPIAAAPPREAGGPSWRRPKPPDPAVQMFQNRLLKNAKHLGKWAKREGVSCYRLYDSDLPEYAVAVDRYEDMLHVQEYAPPSTVDPKAAEARLSDVMAVLPETLGVRPEDVFLKVRRRQRPSAQYARQAASGDEREVQEGGVRFLVNLSDYIDTGLYLDHRRVRALVRELAAGRRFLNLFAYTGTATVNAAAGGARSTVSVDLSGTYLEWAERNLSLNGFRGRAHELVRADCMAWLERERRSFDLIFVAPPTFSNSKRMEGTFDVQRDHAALLARAAARLLPVGVIFFSNHFRRFKMDHESLPDLLIEEITKKTIPVDFARTPRIHNAWKITRR